MSEQRTWHTPRMIKGRISRRTATTAIRVIAVAVLAAGGTFVGCSAHGITAPGAEGGSMSPSAPSRTLGVGGVTETVTNLVSVREEEDESIAKANPDFVTSTETTFPMTEFVVNTCYNNETPILNGYLKQRERIQMDDLTLKYKMTTWKDTRGVAAAATSTNAYDDDRDDATPPRQLTVRYRNRGTTLDKFTVGPAGLPFSSDQESVTWLERLSPEHGMRYGKHDDREDDDDDRYYRHGQGDDLFVYARQSVYVDKNGVTREKTVFRTECR
jgi:hypothetical protein